MLVGFKSKTNVALPFLVRKHAHGQGYILHRECSFEGNCACQEGVYVGKSIQEYCLQKVVLLSQSHGRGFYPYREVS